VLHQIGIGTLGPVFRTYEPTRDRLVAVKVFRLDIIPEQAQVLAEALSRATESSLCHPSIVEPIASGVEGTLAYRAEEYVAAESLDVAMRHYAPAPIEKALPFIMQLAGAIDFARAAGVGHGGLHPRDIFMTPDDARATGFGVVEALERVGIRAPIRRPYSAPERIAGAAWGTPADVFALAAITFELLTARRPAGTGAQLGTLPESERAHALHAVLARAMDDDPARRYASALAFAGALATAARGETEVPGPSVPQSQVPQSQVTESQVTESRVLQSGVAASPGGLRTKGPGTEGPGTKLDGAQRDEADALDDILAERGAGEAPGASRSAARGAEPTLFDEEDSADHDLVGEAVADEGDEERFADDFAVEEELPVFARAAKTEDLHHAAEETVYVAEKPMFSTAGREPEYHDAPEHSRPVILPFAMGLVLGLLGGFGGAYFVLSRDRPVPAAETGAAKTGSQAAAPAGPATPEKPGQYSEQKVSPPSPVTEPASARSTAPPPVTRGTPPASSPAAVPRPEPPAATGHLVVRSTPSRAAVTLNGTWRGRTPLTLDTLPFGTYIVRVVQDGFRVAREEVTLSARDASHTIDARLERIGAGATPRPNPAPVPGRGAAAPPASRDAAPVSLTGSLYVDSRPRGASVIVDGKSVGVTPLSLAEVPAGSHVVRIEMEGKRPWTSTALVTAGKRTPVTGSLEDR
jgi:PEGA domain/Protein kinase domain